MKVYALVLSGVFTNLVFADSAFYQIDLGKAFSYSNLKFVNPVGTGFTSSPTSGDEIILHGKESNDVANVTSIGAGYRWNAGYVAKISLNRYGSLKSNGYATFGGNDFKQETTTDGYSLLVGVGYQYYLSQSLYVEPSVDVGLANLEVSGTQGATGYFPSKTHTNFVYGANFLAGYKVTPDLDLIAEIGYHKLGDVSTGVTDSSRPAGMNIGEQLKNDLDLATVKGGIRGTF
jgi:hypothetical protein